MPDATMRSNGAADGLVRCSEIRRTFGEGGAAVDALRGISVGFPAGQMTSIVGPSGSGKSTLMHVLAGLDRPTSGSVWVDDVEVTGLSDARLTELRRDKLGFVFQFFNLVPVLSAEENVTLPLRIAGRSVDEEWLRSLLDTVGIYERRTHRPAELSGGEQQRVAIARALISRPAVVFADEPTGNLDTRAGGHVLDLLRHSVDEMGQTLIVVTHDSRVASVADRVLLLVDGEIARDTPVSDRAQVLDLMQAI